MESFDLVIVGAGWHGLSMAKTFAEVHPSAKMIVVDSAVSVGGVWAAERLYSGLKTNNLVGSYEFGDFPLSPSDYGLRPGQHIPGSIVHDYLERFVDQFGLRRHLRLQQKVQSAELTDENNWKLTARKLDNDGSPSKPSYILAQKLIIATGLTSEPFVPNLQGMHEFRGRIMHSREMKFRLPEIKADSEVVVVGGNKSAWDACYAAACAGARVHMVLRSTGGGPSWVWPAIIKPFGTSIARLAGTRFFTWFDPCVWGRAEPFPWMRQFLHRTWVGRKFVSLFWEGLGYFARRQNGYDSHPNLQKLSPWASPFWMGNSLSIHNYDSNWFDFVRTNKIKVHIAEIRSLTDHEVHLSTGARIYVDSLVCCTGWKVTPPIKFLPEGIEKRLGFPGEANVEGRLIDEATEKVFSDFPSLRQGPSGRLSRETSLDLGYANVQARQGSPYRLYRFMVPTDSHFLHIHNVGFMGFHLSLNATMVAQVQALWLTAFLDGSIAHLKSDTFDYGSVLYQMVLHTEYCRIRHPPESGGAGNRCPDLVFDSVPYVDLMLDDLGLEKRRKPNFWQEIFGRYLPGDFKGLVEQWLRKQTAKAL